MSYNTETAKKRLTGTAYDEVILNEREQKHLSCFGECAGMHAMPGDEYCELRDMYLKMVHEKKELIRKPLTLEELLNFYPDKKGIPAPQTVYIEIKGRIFRANGREVKFAPFYPGILYYHFDFLEKEYNYWQVCGTLRYSDCSKVFRDVLYGETWRCWQQRPSEQERSAAKWRNT